MALTCARALFAAADLVAAGHKGVIVQCQRHFVKTGKMETEVAKALPALSSCARARIYDDYAEVSAERMRDAGANTAEYVAACETLLETMLRPDLAQ